jgi:predicted methyltransferase
MKVHDKLTLAGAALALLALALPAAAQAPAPAPKDETTLAIEKALASDIRTPEERARDTPERKPVQTLNFFGLKPNMTVVELFPGAGWYTKILGQVLAEKGKLYVTIGQARTATKLAEWKLDKVVAVESNVKLSPSGQFGIFQSDVVEIPIKDADMVLTFRNYHNMTPATRALLNKQIFNALKPGGVYGVVDHTKRHMEPYNPETWRRADPVVVIKEVQAAGFVFEDFSTLHFRPDDTLIFDSQRESIKGYSDRFTLKFRKPLK